MGVRFKKIIRDLFTNKSRTFLAIIALAIGIAGTGFSLTAYTILVREIDKNYMRTNPASIILETENCDEKFISELRSDKLIDSIELRKTVKARYKKNENEWLSASLYVIEDFENIRIDKVSPEIGEWPAKDGEILLERAGVRMVNDEMGNNVTIKLPNEKAEVLKYSGQAYAPGLSPAWMEGMVYGFISMNTYKQLGGIGELNELHIIVKENRFDKSEITKTAYILKGKIEATGRRVTGMSIPKPGKHPHAGQMNSLLFLIQMLGVLALILSSILTVNMISAQISQQKKQIGIMKVLGGKTSQITGIYVLTVVIIGATASFIGIPLGLFLGNIYANMTAGTLNFEILSRFVPHWVFLVQILFGIGLPLVASLFPIISGSKVTVYKAINDQGIDTKEFGSSFVDKALEKLSFIKRPAMLSLRNTFRKRSRFALTLATLAAGGAIFIVAMNFRDSLVYTINKVFETKKYDIQLTLSKAYPKAKVEEALLSLNGVEKVKAIGGAWGGRIRMDGTKSESFRITALPIKENMVVPQMMSGRWLSTPGSNEIVMNQMVFNEENEIEKIIVGDKIEVMLNGTLKTFVLVGIAREPASLPGAYIDLDYFNKNIGSANEVNEILVVAKNHSREGQIELSKEIEKLFWEKDIDVFNTYRLSFYKKIVDDHLFVIFVFLMVVAILIVIIGGIGLASALGINVVERTREIGVMRSIGADGFDIMSMVALESVLTGIISWVIAICVAPALSAYEAEVFGKIFFGTGLDVRVSVTGSLIWLVFVIIISLTASIYPAWKASKISVKDALRYE